MLRGPRTKQQAPTPAARATARQAVRWPRMQRCFRGDDVAHHQALLCVLPARTGRRRPARGRRLAGDVAATRATATVATNDRDGSAVVPCAPTSDVGAECHGDSVDAPTDRVRWCGDALGEARGVDDGARPRHRTNRVTCSFTFLTCPQNSLLPFLCKRRFRVPIRLHFKLTTPTDQADDGAVGPLPSRSWSGTRGKLRPLQGPQALRRKRRGRGRRKRAALPPHERHPAALFCRPGVAGAVGRGLRGVLGLRVMLTGGGAAAGLLPDQGGERTTPAAALSHIRRSKTGRPGCRGDVYIILYVYVYTQKEENDH